MSHMIMQHGRMLRLCRFFLGRMIHEGFSIVNKRLQRPSCRLRFWQRALRTLLKASPEQRPEMAAVEADKAYPESTEGRITHGSARELIHNPY